MAMAICKMCGAEFDVSNARRVVGHRFGAGVYNEEYPDGDVCANCASCEISAALATGEEIIELMGTGWDYD